MRCQSHTAYPATERLYRTALQSADCAALSLTRPISRCASGSCGGMCCYDGVYLNGEEADVIARLATEEPEFFRAQGASTSTVVTNGSWRGKVGLKTLTVPRRFSVEINEYPTHFADTACVFLRTDGLCMLQLLGAAHGRHHWYYKPFTCWLHPLSVSLHTKQIILRSEDDDPHVLPAYPGFVSRTFCGKTSTEGMPAWMVLTEELGFLSEIIGRDLLKEVEDTLRLCGE